MDEEYLELDSDSTCGVCNAEFLDTDDLKVHILQYHLNDTNRRRFCKFCSIIFTDIDAFVKHIRNEHLSTILTCKYCLRVFNDDDSLSKHEKKHKNLKHYPKISCSHCTKLYNDKNDLENHEFKEHFDSGDGVMLQYCFPELSAVIKMNAINFFKGMNDNLHNYKCICSYTTTDVTKYLNHLNSCKSRPFACETCNNVFKRKTSLEYHVKTHYTSQYPNNKNKQCPKCDGIFPVLKIKSHIKKCKSMKCVPCGVSFNSVDKYAIHVTTHSQRPQVKFEVCKYCCRTLVGIDALEKHIERTHKPYLHMYKYYCHPCGKVFKHPKLLFGHFYSRHRDLEPYTCKICDKKFRVRKNFTLHIKLDHKSVGFVEFDSNFHVFFTDKKSKDPFEPRNLDIDNTINIYDEESEDNNEKYKENEVKSMKGIKIVSKKKLNAENTDLLGISEGKRDLNTIQFIEVTEKSARNDEKNTDIVIESSNEIHDIEAELNNDDYAEDDENHKTTINNVTETDNDVDTTPNYTHLKIRNGRKRKIQTKFNQSKSMSSKTVNLLSSDDSDAPLSQFTSKNPKLRKRKYNKKKSIKKFLCKKCDRDCYTYQNYHRHMSLHMKNKQKVCVKCFAKFKTKVALTKHMKASHSHSKLTDTLKKLLDKRKNNNAADASPKTTPTKSNSTNKFLKTMHKVPKEKSNSHATIIVVENNQSSVKKFFQNFKPENETDTRISIKKVTSAIKEPLIKMKSFTPEPSLSEPPKLRMPIKFQEEDYKKPRVSIKLVRCEYVTSSINFEKEAIVPEKETQTEHVEESYEEPYEDNAELKTESIPEVGQEIQVEVCEESKAKVLKKSIVLDNLLTQSNLRIGHLSTQAPYYKIVKINEVLQGKKKSEEPPKPTVNKITLSNGTKLVSVNPLAHLLGKTDFENIINSNTKSYKPKLQNFTEAIVKAISNLDNVSVKSKKGKKDF